MQKYEDCLKKQAVKSIIFATRPCPSWADPTPAPFFDKRSDSVDYPTCGRLPVAFPLQGRGKAAASRNDLLNENRDKNSSITVFHLQL